MTVVLLALASIASAEVLPVAEGPMEIKAMSDWNRTQFLARAAEASGRECYSPIRSRYVGEDKQKNPLWGLECASRKKPLPQFLIGEANHRYHRVRQAVQESSGRSAGRSSGRDHVGVPGDTVLNDKDAGAS